MTILVDHNDNNNHYCYDQYDHAINFGSVSRFGGLAPPSPTHAKKLATQMGKLPPQ